jgi:hypothetical protein
LCGLKKIDGSESYGYIPKKGNIKDLLNIQVGDIKFWKTIMFELGKNDVVYYTKDVCNKVIMNEDSIIIEYLHTEYFDSKPTNIFTIKETYVKTLWDEMIANRQNTIHFINNTPTYNEYNKMGISIVEGAGYLVYQDSTLNASGSFVEYTDNGEFLVGECESMFVTDSFLEKVISCKLGEVYSRGANGFGGNTTSNLIGYLSGGVQYGEIPDYLIGIQEPSSNTISLSPNPASDYITLKIPPLEKRGLGGVLEPISIFDVFGNCVLNVGAIHELPLRIDISTLPAGMYFVRIGDEKPQKFMVVR